MPEKDPFLIVFAPGLLARNDLTQLRVQRLLRQLARADVRAETAELAAFFALPPIVDDDLIHYIGQRDLIGTDGTVGNDKVARTHPCGPEQGLRLHQAGRLDHNIGALKTLLAVFCNGDLLVQAVLQPLGKCIHGFLAATVDANFLKIIERIQQNDIPERRAAAAEMSKDLVLLFGKVFCTDRRDGAGAHGGNGCGIDHGIGRTRLWIKEIQQ